MQDLINWLDEQGEITVSFDNIGQELSAKIQPFTGKARYASVFNAVWTLQEACSLALETENQTWHTTRSEDYAYLTGAQLAAALRQVEARETIRRALLVATERVTQLPEIEGYINGGFYGTNGQWRIVGAQDGEHYTMSWYAPNADDPTFEREATGIVEAMIVAASEPWIEFEEAYRADYEDDRAMYGDLRYGFG